MSSDGEYLSEGEIFTDDDEDDQLSSPSPPQSTKIEISPSKTNSTNQPQSKFQPNVLKLIQSHITPSANVKSSSDSRSHNTVQNISASISKNSGTGNAPIVEGKEALGENKLDDATQKIKTTDEPIDQIVRTEKSKTAENNDNDDDDEEDDDEQSIDDENDDQSDITEVGDCDEYEDPNEAGRKVGQSESKEQDEENVKSSTESGVNGSKVYGKSGTVVKFPFANAGLQENTQDIIRQGAQNCRKRGTEEANESSSKPTYESTPLAKKAHIEESSVSLTNETNDSNETKDSPEIISDATPNKSPVKRRKPTKSIRNTGNYLCTALDLPRSSQPLPFGWKPIIHDTGIPMYFHVKTRVMTFSRPFLPENGKCVRNCEPPISSIPCLEYQYFLKSKNSLTEETSKVDIGSENHQATHDGPQGNNHGQPENSTPGTEDAAESQTSTQLASEDQSISQEVKTTNNSSSVAAHEKKKIDVMKNMPSNITNESLGSYVEKLFVVKSRRPLSALREQKRAVLKAKETAIKKEDRGVPLMIKNGDRYENIRILEANHTTRTYITVLNDYATKAMKATPVYNCSNVIVPSSEATVDTIANANSSLDTSSITTSSAVNSSNAASHTHCVITILNVKYGEAIAVGKRPAKNLAAKEALKVLCPEVLRAEETDLDSEDILLSSLNYKVRLIEVFKRFLIGDTKVVEELKLREASHFAPMQLLNQFLVRNVAPSNMKLHTNFTNVRDPQTGAKMHECDLTLGPKYKAKSMGKTQNIAAQYAALMLLQELHPSLSYYSSLIRLYGIDPSEVQMQKERQIREEVSQSQDSDACDTILKLLREEMKKASEVKGQEGKSKETFDVLKISPEEPEYFYTKLWDFGKT